MSKKDMVANGVFKAIEFSGDVGKHIYVWNANGQKPADGRCAVISAHGLQAKINGAYPAPKMALYFYAPHGYVLQDPGLVRVNDGRTNCYEEIDPGEAQQDYELSKYQGYHSKANETYGYIQKDMQAPNLRAQIEKEPIADFKWIKDEGERTALIAKRQQEKAAKIAGVKEFNMDVITIRHRRGWHSGTVTLFQILNFLYGQGYKYSGIHCSFCRGPRTGKDESWNPGINTGVAEMVKTS
jgi:hypothetical protein